MTFTQAEQEIRAHLSAWGMGAQHGPLVQQQIKRALTWMAHKLEHLQERATIPLVEDQASYALAPDFHKWVAGKWGEKEIRMATRDSLMASSLPAGLDGEKFAYIWENTLYFLPTPDASDDVGDPSIQYDYIKLPALPTGESDTLVTGGVEYEELLIARVKFQIAGFILKDKALYAIVAQEYQDTLHEARISRERQYSNVPHVQPAWI